MKIRKNVKLLLLPFATAVLLLSATKATACWCRTVPPCEVFGCADAVFIGKVVNVQDRSQTDDGEQIIGGNFTFRLRVEKAFLGVQSQTVEVSSGGDNCAIKLLEGESYLVYAFNHQGKLWTNKCSRTKRVDDAEEDLAFLYDLPREGSGARIYGWVSGYTYDQSQSKYRLVGLDGVRVIITGNGLHTKILTNSNGEYELTGLKSGKYTIKVGLPDYYETDFYSKNGMAREIEVNDRGCAREYFAADVKNSVRGRVLNAMGQPLPGVVVTLIPADEEARKDNDAVYKSDTDKEGMYSLKRIAPGRYLLGINVDEDDGDDNDGFFYPGIMSRSKATILEFGLGQELTNYDFRLTTLDIDVK